MSYYWLIIIICGIFLLSYLFSAFSRKWGLSSVILLILTGIFIKYILAYCHYQFNIPQVFIKVIGSIGLIMIVLEGALELTLGRDKIKLILSSIALSVLHILSTAFLIALALYWLTGAPYSLLLLYGIVLSVVSSAMVVPSISNVASNTRELLTYEAIFSDIIGIIIFDMFLSGGLKISLAGLLGGAFSLIILACLSAAAALVLIYLLGVLHGKNMNLLVIIILIMLYSAGKLSGLSSLLLVMAFGLFMNNASLMPHDLPFIRKHWDGALIGRAVDNLRSGIFEYAFFIRTVFFVLFGLTIDVSSAFRAKVVIPGLVILAIIYLIRFIVMGLMIKSCGITEIFVAPRGLITILLFYSIPDEYRLIHFEDNLLFFLIIATGLIMTAALSYSKRQKSAS